MEIPVYSTLTGKPGKRRDAGSKAISTDAIYLVHHGHRSIHTKHSCLVDFVPGYHSNDERGVKRELERLYWLTLRHNGTKNNNVAVVLCVDDSFFKFANSALALEAAFGKESIEAMNE